MEKRNLKNWGKGLMMAFLGFGLISLTGCFPEDDPNNPNGTGGGGNTSADSWAYLINEDVHDVVLDGNTLTYGTHTYTLEGEIDYDVAAYDEPSASLTFTNIPSGYTEFKAVYENFLCNSIAGTAAMIPMAIEIYARDAELGTQCLNLLCKNSVSVANITSILKTKFNYSAYSPEGDQYVQRYLPAATLQGATYSNAYAPNEPYVVTLSASPNGYQDAPLTGGTMYYLYILTSGGWDTYQRAISVFQYYGQDIYKLDGCPSCYTQCRPIQGAWAGLK